MSDPRLVKDGKWEGTVAARCRWSEYARPHFDGWEVLSEDSESDYQGHGSVFARKGNRWRLIEWWYGSCSGCDGYEDMAPDDVTKAFEKLVMTFDSKKELMKFHASLPMHARFLGLMDVYLRRGNSQSTN